MELDIRNLSVHDTTARDSHLMRESAIAQRVRNEKAREIEKNTREQLAAGRNVDVDKYLQEIIKITDIFNRKLKFSVDRELDQVIVKVVDGQTDKVIKEIPSEELQRLYRSMKKTIGLLIDEQI